MGKQGSGAERNHGSTRYKNTTGGTLTPDCKKDKTNCRWRENIYFRIEHRYKTEHCHKVAAVPAQPYHAKET